MEKHQFSYVYMNFIVCGVVSIFLIGFMIQTFRMGSTIKHYHHTISSFCAKKGSWENRFLLFFTTVVGYNLMFLHFEEFNSRQNLETIEYWLFGAEITVIFLFTLVGVFYTSGNNPSTRNAALETGCGNISIALSSAVHSVCAMLFFGVLTAINFGYCMVMYQRFPEKKWTVILFGWAIFSVINGASFLIMQIVLARYRNKETTEAKEKLLIGLRVTSFVLECMWGTSIILLDGICSVRRNRMINWFVVCGEEEMYHM